MLKCTEAEEGRRCKCYQRVSGADPGFLEKGFICIKVGGSFSDILIFFKYPIK